MADATPEAIPYEELDINMGERWIDTKLYADFAQSQLGDIVFVDVPTVGETLAAGDVFGTIEAVKTVSLRC